MFVLMLAVAADLVSRGSAFAAHGPLRRPAAARLVWSDEFDGSRLDTARWSYDGARNKQGWHNEEQQYYAAGRPANLRLGGGQLTIEARLERLDPIRYPDWGGQNYTSARIFTNRAWTHGFYEIRAKLPCARGTWPAIWMLPEKLDKWPDDGEIDIMEQVGAEPHLIYATLHSGRYNHVLGTQRGAQRLLATSCSQFHRYQLDWRPDAITIGIDNHAIMRVRRAVGDRKPEWPFTTPYKLILNLAIGGNWAGKKGIDDSAMPQRMVVDYVRIWQVPPAARGVRR